MIVTVTPNPSIDRTLHIPALERGQLIRAQRATVEAGGKGINVARILDVVDDETRQLGNRRGRGNCMRRGDEQSENQPLQPALDEASLVRRNGSHEA